MSEAKDPAIKLFGKTIPVPEVPLSSGESVEAPEPDPSSGTLVEDTVDQDHASSSNSSPEVNTNGDREEKEVNNHKV